jgi:hypothetical protein
LHFRCSDFPTIWLLRNSYRLNLYRVFGKSLHRKHQIRTRPLSSNIHISSTVYSENRCVGNAKSVTIRSSFHMWDRFVKQRLKTCYTLKWLNIQMISYFVI